MELLTIFLRTILIYFLVFIMLRLMGKREIGKLSIFDVVISIMIAEIAVFSIEDVDRPLAEGILPMLTLVGIQLLIAYITLKSLWLRRLFDGRPSYIIERGRLNRAEMRKQRYNLSDLLLQLRQSNITDIADVEFAILETTGKLTVVKKSDFYGQASTTPASGNAAQFAMETSSEPGDIASAEPVVRYVGLPMPLIMDGKVLDENLEKVGHNRFWLKNQMQVKGVKDFKDVFFCSIDHKGRLYVDKK